MITSNIQNFLNEFFKELDSTGIDYSKFVIDHIGYQCDSGEDYDSKKIELEESADLLNEHIFKERRIGIFKFKNPIEYNDSSIQLLELIEPEPGKSEFSHWEHVEFIVLHEIDELVHTYPDLGWDESALHRDKFPMLKLRLTDSIQVKFPRGGMKREYLLPEE